MRVIRLLRRFTFWSGTHSAYATALHIQRLSVGWW